MYRILSPRDKDLKKAVEHALAVRNAAAVASGLFKNIIKIGRISEFYEEEALAKGKRLLTSHNYTIYERN